MRRLLVGLLLLSAGRCAALDRTAFSFRQYDLKVQVDPAAHGFSARGRITLRNDSPEAQRNVALQVSSSLHWNSVRVNGRTAQMLTQAYTSDIDHTGGLAEAIVTLAAAVPPRGTVDLDVSYEGEVSADLTRLTRIGVPEAEARRSDWDQVSPEFTAVRGAGYVAWYPVAMQAASLSEGNAIFAELAQWREREQGAGMQVELCTLVEGEQAPVVVMNGRELAVSGGLQGNSGRMTKCGEYALEALGRETPTFAVGQYQTLERPAISVTHLPEHRADAQDYALAAEKAEPLVTDWLGERRQKVRVIELADRQAAPYESGAVLFTPLGERDGQRLQLQMAHQLAHACFDSPRAWIYEGLAHFAQALEREQQQGRDAALRYMSVRLPALVAAEKPVDDSPPGKKPPGQPLVTASDEIFYRGKAMYVWWMLRDLAGDLALQRALRAYRAAADKEPSYMQRLIAAQDKQDLEWFFDDWVYRDRGLPDFTVAAANPRATLAKSYVVAVTVRNAGDARAQVPVGVRAEGQNGEAWQRVMVPARGDGVTRIEIPAAPVEAIVNDGSVPERDTANNAMKIAVEGAK